MMDVNCTPKTVNLIILTVISRDLRNQNEAIEWVKRGGIRIFIKKMNNEALAKSPIRF
jgi:hypothetical protein